MIWGLLAFARREFDRFFSALAGKSTAATTAPAATSVTALTEPPARFALASSTIAAPEPTYVSPPAPFRKDVSTSTEFIGWVTGSGSFTPDCIGALGLGVPGVYCCSEPPTSAGETSWGEIKELYR